MIEFSQTLQHKAILHILPTKSIRGIRFTRLVLSILYDVLAGAVGFKAPIEEFCSNLNTEIEDGSYRLQTVSVPPFGRAAHPFLWALRLDARNLSQKHSVQTIHIGIHQLSDFELTLYFASLREDCPDDHLTAIPPNVCRISPLVETLLTHPDLHCVTGNHVLLNKSIRLTKQSMGFFLELLFDASRTIPIILVACPELVDPDCLHACLQGNAVICYTREQAVLLALNDRLPAALSAAEESIRIYLPMGKFPLQQELIHPYIPLSEICRMGANGIYTACYRAYGAHLRRSECDEFVTVDTCKALIREQELAALNARIVLLERNLSAAEAALVCSEEKHNNLRAEVDILKASCKDKNISAYEEMLSDSLSEVSMFKTGIQSLLCQLYTPGESIHLDDSASPLLHDFCEALQYRLRFTNK